MDPFQLAAQQMGMNENAQNAALQEYMSNGGVNLDPAVTAWCAAYVNATLAQTGYKGTGSNLARDFLDWGVDVQDPQKGDLAVFWRDDPNGPYGHVGFFDGYNDDGTIRVLGGNQGNSVSIAGYSPDQLLGFRRPEDGWGNALSAGGTGTSGPAAPMGNALQRPEQPQFQYSNFLDPASFMTAARFG